MAILQSDQLDVLSAGTSDETSEKTRMRVIMISSVIGTTVEWYDFLLYGTAAALLFNKLFFPAFDPFVGTIASLASFAAGFIARPLGGAIFGHFGDRIGRKTMLMITMFMMGGATFLIGLLPTYSQIGVWAPVILITLRILQGIGLGGEWGGAALMVVEHAPPNRRGFFGGIVQVGFPLGIVLSTAAFAAVSRLPEAQFLAWGWRLPFLISIGLVMVGLVIRLRVSESPEFLKAMKHDAPIKMPLLEVFRSYKRSFFVSVGLKISEVAWVYLLSVFLVMYGNKTVGIPKTVMLSGLLLAATLEFITVPLAGYLSDIFGRKPLYYFGAASTVLAAFPLFWLVQSGDPMTVIITMAVCMSLGHATLFGPQAACIPELFGTKVRYSGCSLGVQVAAAIGGGLTPIAATSLMAFTGHIESVSCLIALLGIFTLIATYAAGETSGSDLSKT
ncbi:MHS family shikimate/dehydroshikimate transporter-like MFS transporter [Paraburkholderia sp. BL6665CI2N2]|uniref:MFS transporter n=1 Tax=Paraburkholderia sp. BL6665CI2N2 TaxID=1938806 RepID=UPI0010650745|nr:MFS transporter [Paraburkholderia sp. BL6665CI2N2]TDY22080.1 MHS family shikimate/dehydroshikimate transporter-like MFS transporter [Paraburkholderia sp. BL6665CI2N2]